MSDRQINEPINSILIIYSQWLKCLILIFNFHPALLLVYIPLTSNENEKLRGLLITIRLINNSLAQNRNILEKLFNVEILEY